MQKTRFKSVVRMCLSRACLGYRIVFHAVETHISINQRQRFAFVSPRRMAPLLALSIGLTNLEFWISKRLVASHAKAIGTKSLSLSLSLFST
eukprot:COSAG06_NODE_36814_length_442_cov_1.201166_1_plen_92_part_00